MGWWRRADNADDDGEQFEADEEEEFKMQESLMTSVMKDFSGRGVNDSDDESYDPNYPNDNEWN